jgi:hypothetical protein
VEDIMGCDEGVRGKEGGYSRAQVYLNRIGEGYGRENRCMMEKEKRREETKTDRGGADQTL